MKVKTLIKVLSRYDGEMNIFKAMIKWLLQAMKELTVLKYTANFDASFNPESGRVGIGYTIKKGNKFIYKHKDEIFRSTKFYTSMKAEMESLTRLLNKIEEMNINKVKVYGDCLPLIDALNNECNMKTRSNKFRIENVMKCTENIKNIKFIWIPRKNNRIADALTR